MAIDFNQNYFQLFELENSFDVNYESLERKYLSFQKSFHPDKFVNASDQEKRISLQIISHIHCIMFFQEQLVKMMYYDMSLY